MQLIVYPDPVLLRKCLPATKNKDKNRAKLAAKMWRIMYEHNGIGLAAPQVGLSIRMFVWVQNGSPQAIWNPKLSAVSGSANSMEGCLSLPKFNVTVKRATTSILNGEGINGRQLRFIGNVNTTRVWQHEIDHLDGKLLVHNMDYDDLIKNQDALKELLINRKNK